LYLSKEWKEGKHLGKKENGYNWFEFDLFFETGI